MDHEHRRRSFGGSRPSETADPQRQLAPGKRTLVEGITPGAGSDRSAPPLPAQVHAAASPPASAAREARPTLQMLFGSRAAGPRAEDPDQIRAVAERGKATPASRLPYVDIIQRAFGRHDISGINAHVGPAAAVEMGAKAYATGDHVVLGESADLHTVAHEAAHVVQQRGGVQLAGGVGTAGDAYEQHADEVADRVVRGESAEAVLDRLMPTAESGHRSGPSVVIQRKIQIGGMPSCLSYVASVLLNRYHLEVSAAQRKILEEWDTAGEKFDDWDQLKDALLTESTDDHALQEGRKERPHRIDVARYKQLTEEHLDDHVIAPGIASCAAVRIDMFRGGEADKQPHHSIVFHSDGTPNSRDRAEQIGRILAEKRQIVTSVHILIVLNLYDRESHAHISVLSIIELHLKEHCIPYKIDTLKLEKNVAQTIDVDLTGTSGDILSRYQDNTLTNTERLRQPQLDEEFEKLCKRVVQADRHWVRSGKRLNHGFIETPTRNEFKTMTFREKQEVARRIRNELAIPASSCNVCVLM